METQPKDLSSVLAILKRRKWQIIGPACLLFAASALAAVLMPAAYRSTATILIEDQEIPQELVRSTITSFADQRIQVISQQVMTRGNLAQIVEKFDLYKRLRARETNDTVVEKLRDNIKLDIVSADMVDKRSGSKTAATIAFTIAYDGETPEQAQRVANELVSLYLNENLKNRQQKAADASKFLSEEAQKLAEQIADIEARLAEFKEKNQGRLPELTQLNIQSRERTESELIESDRLANSLLQRRALLEAELAQVKPYAPIISATGERIMDPEERLKLLKAQFATVQAIYSSEHPDVQKLKLEIDGLESHVALEPTTLIEKKQIENVRGELASARKKYSDEHPDVIKLKASLDGLERAAAYEPRATALEARRAKVADNPAYLTIKSQLDGTEAELAAVKARQSELRAKIAQYEKRLRETPQIERQALDLGREYDNATRRYHEIRAKLMEAQVAQELEKDRKGERFSLIDPPALPEKAERPNRRAILALGLVLSIGGGLTYGGLQEALDHTVRGAQALSGALKAPLLAVIPYIRTRREIKRTRRLRALYVFVGLLWLALGLALIHRLWVPLDVLWFTLQRKLGI